MPVLPSVTVPCEGCVTRTIRSGSSSASVSLNVRLPGPALAKTWLPFSGAFAASSSAAGAAPVLIMMSLSSGDTSGSVEERTASYWMYREVRLSGSPDAIGCHEPTTPPWASSVLPARTLIATLVPAGSLLTQLMARQGSAEPASNTRDVNVPGVRYGDMRIQSTAMMPPNTLKSLAATGRMGPAIATACDATGAPSM